MDEHQNFVSFKSTPTIINLFQSPTSAFFATEQCMALPPIEFPAASSSFENFSLDSTERRGEDSEYRNTLQSVVKSQLVNRSIFGDHKVFDESTRSTRKRYLVPFKDQGGCCDSIAQPSLCSSQVKNSPRFSRRIRWTQDLHEKFVDCVKCLGGAEKATPKAILKVMDSEGLTIFHVKSHLQKYRMAKHMPESAERKFDRRNSMDEVVAQLDVKTAMQLKDSLQLQLDVQRRLHDQLEIQRTLQLQIEEQGKQLKMMFDQQQKTNKDFFKSNGFNTQSPSNMLENLDIPPIPIVESIRNAQFPSKIW